MAFAGLKKPKDRNDLISVRSFPFVLSRECTEASGANTAPYPFFSSTLPSLPRST